MEIRLQSVDLSVQRERLRGTVLSPASELPGVLFVHGWGGSQEHDLVRARQAAGLGCVCLTFDLRGHQDTAGQSDTVTRPQNLDDLLAAYDWLASQHNVDQDSISVIGISYGGYLASLLTELRQVRWLALRSPALYKDEGWELPKRQLHQEFDLHGYRRSRVAAEDNRALRACAAFTGDVLLVEAEQDEVVPHEVTDNYAAAFGSSRSLTRRRIAGADHAFNCKSAQRAYTGLLVGWLTEMITGARADLAEARLEERKREKAG